jgi:hypothetical protein
MLPKNRLLAFLSGASHTNPEHGGNESSQQHESDGFPHIVGGQTALAAQKRPNPAQI